MENKGFKFFKKGSAFLIAPALSSSFLPGMSASTVGGNVVSKAASKGAISKFGAGAVKFLGNHWVKLALLVSAGLLAWYLWPSDESEGTSELGEQINQYNNNNDENNINNNENNINNDINSNYNSNNNNPNVANHDLRNLYRKKLDEYKKTLTVDSVNRQIRDSSGAFFRYEWVFVRNCYLIKLSKFWSDGLPGDGQPVYIFPTNDGRVFGFFDASEKKDLSFMLQPCDLNNFVELNDLWLKAFDGQLFSTESVGNCSNKLNLFEQFRFKREKHLDLVGERQIALFELIRDNDQNFWNMINNPALIQQDIQNHQPLKLQQGMMAMNNYGMLLNMGNNMRPMMPNMNMVNNMPPNIII